MPKFAWDDFLNHRKSLGGKKRFTKRGQELALKKLNQLRNEGSDPQMVVEQSIANGWTGLFPIRDKKTQPGSRDGNDDWMRGLL